MNPIHVLEEMLANLLVRLGLWLIARIASPAGAEDLTYLVAERKVGGAIGTLVTLGQSVWAAVVDRALCIDLALASINARMLRRVTLRAVMRHESLLCYFGASFFFALIFVTLAPFGYAVAAHIAPWLPAKLYDMAVIALYSFSIFILVLVARALLENPSADIGEPFVMITTVMTCAGVISGVELLRMPVAGPRFCLALVVFATIVAYAAGQLADWYAEYTRARQLATFRYGWLFFSRRYVNTELPKIERAQFERRGRHRLARW